jgi:hypothetical protein
VGIVRGKRREREPFGGRLDDAPLRQRIFFNDISLLHVRSVCTHASSRAHFCSRS